MYILVVLTKTSEPFFYTLWYLRLLSRLQVHVAKKKVIDYAPSLALSLHTASKAGWAQKQESLNDHKDPVSPTQKEISLLKFNANIVLNEFYPHE